METVSRKAAIVTFLLTAIVAMDAAVLAQNGQGNGNGNGNRGSFNGNGNSGNGQGNGHKGNGQGNGGMRASSAALLAFARLRWSFGHSFARTGTVRSH